MSRKRYLLDIPTTFPGARMKKPDLMAATVLERRQLSSCGTRYCFRC